MTAGVIARAYNFESDPGRGETLRDRSRHVSEQLLKRNAFRRRR